MALGTVKFIPTQFLYVILHHIPMYTHAKYEGTGPNTGPKGKRLLPRIELYDKYKLFDFVVKGQGHSKLMFVIVTPTCIIQTIHTYATLKALV